MPLNGKWRIAIDGNFKDWPFKTGETEKWYAKELPSNESLFLLNQIYFKNADFRTNDWINLPGTTDEACIGEVLQESSKYSMGLERNFTYDGAFWVQRKVSIPQSWEGKQLNLFLERTLGSSTLYWDDKKIGNEYSYATPHKFIIDDSVKSGEHRLTILINKDDLRYISTGHHIFNSTGASWNGIIGRIELIAKNLPVHIKNVHIYPDLKSESINMKIIFSKDSTVKKRNLKIFVKKKNENSFLLLKNVETNTDSLNLNCELPKPVNTWSEFSPYLYELKCILEENGNTLDSCISTFGMRELGRQDGYITINGNKITLRGTLDCGSYPLTGYTYMNKEKWLQTFATIKSFGLNHVRYHTWCPPEAAFAAADESGIYLQVELAGAPYSEINQILNTYGNHPSFCMLSLNNEVMGNTELNEKIVAIAKLYDTRHLYSCTSHPVGTERNDDFFISAWGTEKIEEWPFAKPIVGITWGGGDVVHSSRFNLFAPETVSTFSEEIKGIQTPIIAHEMGQWAVFPDFDEISKYSGVLRNTNYERIKKQNEKIGLLAQNKQFAKASGMFSSILYKEEIESVLRTPNYAGFQILGLNDYQGQYISIVGILNDFWESKGLVTPDQHSQYCNAIVPLAKMEKRIWNNTEIFRTQVVISNFTFTSYSDIKPTWTLTDQNQKVIKKGILYSQNLIKGALTSFSDILIPLNEVKKASKLLLTISIPGLNAKNSWEIWVYPEEISDNMGEVNILNAKDWEKAKSLLREGKTVMLLLDANTLKSSRESCFTTIFWNSIHKWPQKSHTMGILCDPEHQAFNNFPTDFYSNWQWWEIAMNANAMDISCLPNEISPLIQVIDSYIINTKLAYLWECKTGGGKLMVSSINFSDNMNKRIASKQLKSCILRYMNSRDFNPIISLDFSQIEKLIY
jgi:hypothetical protein